MASRLDCVEQGPPIEVFLLLKLFSEDTYQNKVNLCVDAYRAENGKPWLLPVVRKTEQQMAYDDTLLHEYLPVLGLEQFTCAAVKMLLGEDNPAVTTGRAIGIQSLSSTGGLRVAAEFLQKHLKYSTFYISAPCRENHYLVFKDAGFKFPREYRYWDSKNRCINFDGLLEDLRAAAENSVVLLHACGHSPTGLDPTQEQWEKIAEIMEENKLFPVFDCSYQGLASGDLDKDAWAVRYFVQRGFELFCAQSFTKTFGLYGERIGNLTVVMKSAARVAACKSQLVWIVRSLYSTPPAHGARIVASVINNKQLFQEWNVNLKLMSSRIIQMREALRAELIKLQTPGSWEHIVKQTGIFSYTGLTQRQSEYMVQDFHVYLIKSGRVNISGLNPSNVIYVAKAMNDAIAKFPTEDYTRMTTE